VTFATKPVWLPDPMLNLDPDYAEAVVNPDTRFPILSHRKRPASKLDAIYIPTQKHRPPPETSLALLAQAAVEVHLLFSENGKPDWFFELGLKNVFARTVTASKRDMLNSRLDSTRNPGNRHAPSYDIPYKRNLALLESRRARHKSIGLLDDDILLSVDQLDSVVAALTADADMVSFHVLDYPDVSTVDHVERVIRRRPSRVSIGGNCLFFLVDQAASFFPEAYNDDWFFLFSHVGHSRIASLGVAKQRPYRPWLDHGRIAFEQFGDITIEGAKENIREGRAPFSGDLKYWQVVLDRYLARLDGLVAEAPESPFRTALIAAREVAGALDALAFVCFLENYRADSRTFALHARDHMDGS
jgi:hypothetical protein